MAVPHTSPRIGFLEGCLALVALCGRCTGFGVGRFRSQFCPFLAVGASGSSRLFLTVMI